MKRKLSSLKLLFSVIWQANKWYIPWLILNALFSAGETLLNIYIPAIFINAYQEKWEFHQLLITIGLILLVKWFVKTMQLILNRELKLQTEGMQNSFVKAISQKSISLRYDKLEDPAVLDLKERAMFPITNYGAMQNFLKYMTSFLTSLFTITGTIIIILNFSLVLLLISILLSVVMIVLDAKMSKFMQAFQQELIPTNRKYGYYFGLFIGDKYQKEIRLFELQDVLSKIANRYISQCLDKMHAAYIQQGNMNSVRSVVEALLKAITYIFVGLRVLNNRFGQMINIANFTVIIGANEKLVNSFKTIFTDIVDFYVLLLQIDPLYDFMQLESDAADHNVLVPEKLEELEFRHVTFAYPNSDRVILDNISFTLKKGEKISIVGLNNAGKTTIVKLICRFFKPQQGEILWNGKNIEEYNMEAYQNKIACVFQDFALFPLSIKDNIITHQKFEQEKFVNYLEEVNLLEKISELPNGMNTMLNKSLYEDSTDFSGGEKQKIAIARSLYKDGDVVIMDEPTAALDPLAESEIYENFHEMTLGKTAIFISHRMSSSLFCDKILLLSDGKIAAFDSHQNLMRSHNLYRELFETQARHFEK